jgi:Arc/MetJ-type ribon-helix-helix transcriptional regulator
MTTAKLAITLPTEVLKLAKKQVKSGRAKSLSAFISEAVDEKLRRDELEKLLDALDLQHGPPNRAAQRWAKRVLARSS